MAEEKKRGSRTSKSKTESQKIDKPAAASEASTKDRSAETASPPKRLYRSVADRYIAGVCGGVAQYFQIDPTLVRILWAIFTIFGGIGFVAYLAAWIIIPENPDEFAAHEEGRASSSDNLGLIIGVVLIVLGLALLLEELNFRFIFPWRFHFFDGSFLLSILVIGLGLYLIFKKDEPSPIKTEASPMETKRLTRTIHDRKIAGVCGGLARYFNVDPSIVRVLYVLLTISSLFLGIIAYIVMAIVIPEEDEQISAQQESQS